MLHPSGKADEALTHELQFIIWAALGDVNILYFWPVPRAD
jgi:hypothetical protein